MLYYFCHVKIAAPTLSVVLFLQKLLSKKGGIMMMNPEQPSITPESGEHSFLEMLKIWLGFGGMTEAFFSQELSRVSVRNTWIGILLASVLASFFSVALMLLNAAIAASTKHGAASSSATTSGLVILVIGLCCVEFILPAISLYFSNTIVYVLALIFGGKGSYQAQVYLSSLFFVPLTVISLLSTLFSLIPSIGNYIIVIVSLGIGLLNIVYMVRVLKVVHGFSTGRAIVAFLAPLALALIPICLIAILTIMGPAFGNVFSTINSQLGTPTP